MPQLLTRNALNIYSPKIVSQNGKMVMYCGGWMQEQDKPHDAIWRIQTNRRGVWGVFSKVLIPTPELYQVNDPVPVDMGEYWVMYLTGNSSWDPENPTNSIYFCTSWDGIGWSRPQLLMNNYWLPSVTKKDGRVFMFATPTWAVADVFRFDLGLSGVEVGTPVKMSMPAVGYNFVNVDVIYFPRISMWQMLGENLDEEKPSSFIDYLYSSDGVKWLMGKSHVITAPAGGSVRTPAIVDSAYRVIYAQSSSRDGDHNKIYFHDWS